MFQAAVITKTEVIYYLSAYYLRNFSTQTYISPRNMMHREMCHRSSLKYICVWRVETRLVERKYELKLKFHRTQKLTACKENFRKMRAIMIIKLFLREVIEFLTLLSCKTGPEGIHIYTQSDSGMRDLADEKIFYVWGLKYSRAYQGLWTMQEKHNWSKYQWVQHSSVWR